MRSIEHKILTCAANLDPDEDDFQKLRGCMSTGTDTSQLIDLAHKEGMTGFLYKNLLKAGLLETLDPHHRQRLYESYYLAIRHNLKLIHTLNEILKPLVQRRIQVILTQGISLLQEVYRDIGLRPMTDLDLWVLPGDYDALADSLTTQGFASNSLYPYTFKKGEVILDIHTHFLWGDRIRSRDMLINIGQEEIFKAARPINVYNPAALCLDPPDHFLYLSLHALKHNLERLIWLVDLKCLVAKWNRTDWKALTTRAEQLGQQATLFYILFILTKIFCLQLPPEVSASLDGWAPNWFERRVLTRRINGKPIPDWCQLVLISAGIGLRERLIFIGETLFPRPKILRQVFPNCQNSSDRQLYWKRFLQILGSFKT